jgi:hypothetical protein
VPDNRIDDFSRPRTDGQLGGKFDAERGTKFAALAGVEGCFQAVRPAESALDRPLTTLTSRDISQLGAVPPPSFPTRFGLQLRPRLGGPPLNPLDGPRLIPTTPPQEPPAPRWRPPTVTMRPAVPLQQSKTSRLVRGKDAFRSLSTIPAKNPESTLGAAPWFAPFRPSIGYPPLTG